jgi:hypothetical protein
LNLRYQQALGIADFSSSANCFHMDAPSTLDRHHYVRGWVGSADPEVGRLDTVQRRARKLDATAVESQTILVKRRQRTRGHYQPPSIR